VSVTYDVPLPFVDSEEVRFPLKRRNARASGPTRCFGGIGSQAWRNETPFGFYAETDFPTVQRSIHQGTQTVSRFNCAYVGNRSQPNGDLPNWKLRWHAR
jgi:hypothetical protein